eukprot:scaffold7715_cov210-Pinguiococcus_pyrenoidosus.AAC.2
MVTAQSPFHHGADLLLGHTRHVAIQDCLVDFRRSGLVAHPVIHGVGVVLGNCFALCAVGLFFAYRGLVHPRPLRDEPGLVRVDEYLGLEGGMPRFVMLRRLEHGFDHEVLLPAYVGHGRKAEGLRFDGAPHVDQRLGLQVGAAPAEPDDDAVGLQLGFDDAGTVHGGHPLPNGDASHADCSRQDVGRLLHALLAAIFEPIRLLHGHQEPEDRAHDPRLRFLRVRFADVLGKGHTVVLHPLLDAFQAVQLAPCLRDEGSNILAPLLLQRRIGKD